MSDKETDKDDSVVLLNLEKELIEIGNYEDEAEKKNTDEKETKNIIKSKEDCTENNKKIELKQVKDDKKHLNNIENKVQEQKITKKRKTDDATTNVISKKTKEEVDIEELLKSLEADHDETAIQHIVKAKQSSVKKSTNVQNVTENYRKNITNVKRRNRVSLKTKIKFQNKAKVINTSKTVKVNENNEEISTEDKAKKKVRRKRKELIDVCDSEVELEDGLEQSNPKVESPKRPSRKLSQLPARLKDFELSSDYKKRVKKIKQIQSKALNKKAIKSENINGQEPKKRRPRKELIDLDDSEFNSSSTMSDSDHMLTTSDSDYENKLARSVTRNLGKEQKQKAYPTKSNADVRNKQFKYRTKENLSANFVDVIEKEINEANLKKKQSLIRPKSESQTGQKTDVNLNVVNSLPLYTPVTLQSLQLPVGVLNVVSYVEKPKSKSSRGKVIDTIDLTDDSLKTPTKILPKIAPKVNSSTNSSTNQGNITVQYIKSAKNAVPVVTTKTVSSQANSVIVPTASLKNDSTSIPSTSKASNSNYLILNSKLSGLIPIKPGPGVKEYDFATEQEEMEAYENDLRIGKVNSTPSILKKSSSILKSSTSKPSSLISIPSTSKLTNNISNNNDQQIKETVQDKSKNTSHLNNGNIRVDNTPGSNSKTTSFIVRTYNSDQFDKDNLQKMIEKLIPRVLEKKENQKKKSNKSPPNIVLKSFDASKLNSAYLHQILKDADPKISSNPQKNINFTRITESKNDGSNSTLTILPTKTIKSCELTEENLQSLINSSADEVTMLNNNSASEKNSLPSTSDNVPFNPPSALSTIRSIIAKGNSITDMTPIKKIEVSKNTKFATSTPSKAIPSISSKDKYSSSRNIIVNRIPMPTAGSKLQMINPNEYVKKSIADSMMKSRLAEFQANSKLLMDKNVEMIKRNRLLKHEVRRLQAQIELLEEKMKEDEQKRLLEKGSEQHFYDVVSGFFSGFSFDFIMSMLNNGNSRFHSTAAAKRVRHFAIALQDISPDAYQFVRRYIKSFPPAKLIKRCRNQIETKYAQREAENDLLRSAVLQHVTEIVNNVTAGEFEFQPDYIPPVNLNSENNEVSNFEVDPSSIITENVKMEFDPEHPEQSYIIEDGLLISNNETLKSDCMTSNADELKNIPIGVAAISAPMQSCELSIEPSIPVESSNMTSIIQSGTISTDDLDDVIPTAQQSEDILYRCLQEVMNDQDTVEENNVITCEEVENIETIEVNETECIESFDQKIISKTEKYHLSDHDYL